MDRLSFSDSLTIAASPEKLYDMISDVTRMGEWSPICKECWWDEGHVPEAGAWFTGRNVTPERTWETRSQVIVADRGREFTFAVNGTWIKWSYRFDAVEGGTTVTESWAVYQEAIDAFDQRYGERAGEHLENRIEAAHTGIPATLLALKAAAEA